MISILIAGLWLGIVPIAGTQLPANPIVAAHAGMTVKVFTETHQYSEKRSWTYWGGGSADSVTVANIIVSHRAKPVHIFRSAYSDLADVNAVRIVTKAQGFDILITGGDAGSSYRAVLVVRNGGLTERTVRSGEFPSHHWESTKYTNLPPEG